jgi:hypothetical protein
MTEEEKAAEVLKKREAARKGLAPKKGDPSQDEDHSDRDVTIRELGIGLGVKRSG